MWGATMLMLVGHGLFKAVNRVFPYLGRGCIVALATVSILILPPNYQPQLAGRRHLPLFIETVNRVHKADRLPMARIERPDGELPVVKRSSALSCVPR